jgi:hypothetical protein
MILSWEPNYANHDINEFSFALGIYIAYYFTFENDNGYSPYKDTDEENSISLLNLTRHSDTPRFSYYNAKEQKMYVHYSFQRKLWANRNQELMEKLDEKFVKAKKSELLNRIGTIPKTKYDHPLSFILEEKVVNSILAKAGITI